MPATTPAPARRAREDADEPDRRGNSIRRYLREIGRTALLTAGEEVDLAKRIEAGVYACELLHAAAATDARLSRGLVEDLHTVARDGAGAMDTMIRSNLKLVVSIAARFSQRLLPLADLIQEGNIGLIRAVQKFDYTRGCKFSTYATWWIRQAMERAIAGQGRTVRVPTHVIEENARFDRVTAELRLRLGHEPTDQEIAEAAGVPAERIADLRTFARCPVSLDALAYGDQRVNVGDLVADTEAPEVGERIESREIARQVRAAVDRLPDRTAQVVRLRYGLSDGEPHAQQDTASQLGLTRYQAAHLERLALRQLRHGELARLLRPA